MTIKQFKQATEPALLALLTGAEENSEERFTYMSEFCAAYRIFLIESRKTNYEDASMKFCKQYGDINEAEKTAHKYYNILSGGLEAFKIQEKKDIEKRYNAATEKAFTKIQSKLTGEIKILECSLHLGCIDMIITDGKKSVSCQTILAWGMIQRPHYRYLVK